MKRVVKFNKAYFRKSGTTQRAVARELGVDEAYLSKIARGLIEPGIAKAIRIARALQCQVEDLWSGPTRAKP